jgi:hypothetical protein
MFEVGEKVVCVDDGVRETPVPPQLKKGSIYTVVEHGAILGYIYVKIEEIDTRAFNGSIGFYPDRFAPIQKKETSIEVFKKLLIQTPETVDG